MIPLEEAIRIVEQFAGQVAPVAAVVKPEEGCGRVLLAPARATLDLPPFDKSAVDGYAIPAGDEREEYRVRQIVAAGQAAAQPLEAGVAVKVMTGAPVPPGTGRVVMIEHVRREGDRIVITAGESGVNICPRAQDVRAGDVVLTAGKMLNAIDVANLIACGIRTITVARPLCVEIIATGDEIVESAADLSPGRIVDANGPLLDGLCRQWGMSLAGRSIVADDRTTIAGALRTALERADITIITGGVSVGDFDFVPEALADNGLSVHFTRVAVKPGKPTTFASRPGRAVFGLPGNPASVCLVFHLLVMRLAAAWLRTPPMQEHPVPLGAAWQRRKAERREYVPCVVGPDGALRAVEFHGSAHLAALSSADGFFAVPMGTKAVEEGQRVGFMPLPWGRGGA